MKKILAAVSLVAVFSAFSADDKLNNIKPDAEKALSAPTAVEWQNANDARLASETSDAALAAAVSDEASAKALLAKLKGAYSTDPMTASTVAAVSQYVMIGADAAWYEFWRESRPKARDIWSQALIETAKASADAYVKQFCLDQLRWCGKPSQSVQVKEIAGTSSAKEVKDFADMVARELESCLSSL